LLDILEYNHIREQQQAAQTLIAQQLEDAAKKRDQQNDDPKTAPAESEKKDTKSVTS